MPSSGTASRRCTPASRTGGWSSRASSRRPSSTTPTTRSLQVFTHPDHRRRGHGSAMLAHLEQVAAGLGRTVLNAEAAWPYDADPDGRGTPHGRLPHRSRLPVRARGRAPDPRPPGRRLRCSTGWPPRRRRTTRRTRCGRGSGGYPTTSWRASRRWSPCSWSRRRPASWSGSRRAPTSTPCGDARRLTASQGRTTYNTVALDAAGEVVAYSNLAVTTHDPDNAFQWGTLVRRADRGHRLGMAVKVATLRLLQRRARSAPGGCTRGTPR